MSTVQPPLQPMLAKANGSTVPEPDSVPGGLAYEPKWDGFRALIFRDGSDILIQSRSADRPAPQWDLTYAFPEAVEYLRDLLPDRCVLDGELVIISGDRLSFDSLGMRLRPRKEAGGWKIAELSEQLPTSFIAFDLLSLDGEDLLDRPDLERRDLLVGALGDCAGPVHVTARTSDHDLARRWFASVEGAGLDGLIARPLANPYLPGKRAMLKVKPSRTADVVVAGWRPYKNPGADGGEVVGSLILGLFDEAGVLHHVGVASSFTAAARASLVDTLAPYALGPGDSGPDSEHPWLGSVEEAARRPGAPSRWSGGKNLDWYPLRPELVAEVGYDHMEGDRFRHIATFKRWRPDREPASCRYDQLETVDPISILRVIEGDL